MQHQVKTPIEASPERVWAVLTDVERWPEWTESMTTVQRVDDGPFGVGSVARVKQPRLAAAEWRVIDFEPGRSFDWISKGRGVTTRGEHRIDPTGNGHVEVTLGIHQSGPASGLLGLLFGGLIRRYLRIEADGLKRYVEAETSD